MTNTPEKTLRRLSILILISYSLMAALNCGDDSNVQRYKTPKQFTNVKKSSDSKDPHGDNNDHEEHDHSAHGKPSWKVPAGWKEKSKKTSSMRLASFLIPGADKKSNADASIVVLQGEAGGLVANVNRWREQVGLSSVSKSAVTGQARTVKGPAGKFKWFLIKNGQNNQAILAGVLTTSQSTLFVKATGPAKTLERNQAKFLALCKSISL